MKNITPINDELGAPYYAASDELPSIETAVPDSMADDIHSAMRKLKEAVGGSTVDFVCERLQWSKQEISERLFAEQVDAVALAIYNIEARDQAIIIGDQTGIGKGRMAASLIRYAHVQGKRAVFVTEGAKLFSDIYRDLCDTGSADLVPFIINNDSEANIKELDQNGECKRVIYTHLPEKESLKIMENCALPKKFDYVLGTYSQFRVVSGKNGKNSRIRAEFLSKLIEKEHIILILDEAHNAAGSSAGTDRYGNETQEVKSSSTFKVFSNAVKEADGVCFLSATFAKKPDNMPLYAMRSCLRDSGISDSDLIRAIKRGGEALQEIISASMVAEGQMIRREKSFEDIDVNYFYLDKSGEEKGLPNLEVLHRTLSDNVTELMRDIINFESKYIQPVIEAINESIASSGSTNVKSDNKMGVTRSSYFSRIHNIIGQMLLSIKAEAVADHAIRRLREGKKVVIAIAKTNESLLKDLAEEFGIKSNDGKTVRTDFAMSLLRGLRKCFDYTQKDEKGNTVKDSETGKSAVFHIEVEQLTAEGQDEYAKLVQKISTAQTGITCSPIDIIEHKLLQAGYQYGELTGRSVKMNFTDNSFKTGVIQTRKKEDPNSIIKAFQTNAIDVVLLNSSAATGVSLHATNKGTDLKESEVKPRCMIIAECELNVSTEVQKRGRINRTGQIKSIPPSYDYLMSAVPCEQRNMMMLQKKLLSLDANTTSKQKQSTKIIDVPDFINKYGNQTVTQYLMDNTELNEKLDDPLNLTSDRTIKEIANGNYPAEAALKVSRLTATLKCDEQDDFYSNVMASYQQLITNLKQRGEYDLEVAEMPLNATLLGTKSIFTAPSSTGRSVFANASFIGRYECDVLVKPYSRSQVEGFLQAFKNEHPDKTPEEVADELAEDFERKAFAAKKVREIEINANYAVKLAEIDKNKNLDKESKDIKIQKLNDEKATKLFKAEAECNRKRMRKGILKYFYAGRNCYDEFGYAICLGAKIGKAKNPYAPSNITIEFAAASSLKFYSYNLSDDGFRSLTTLKEATNLINKTDVLENWDSLIKDAVKNREVRRIITGNILAAYPEFIKAGDDSGNPNGKGFLGKLITFTLSDGSKEKGILFPATKDDNKGETEILTTVPIDLAVKYFKKQIKKQSTADMEREFEVNFTKGIKLNFLIYAKSSDVCYLEMTTPMRTKYYKEFTNNVFWIDDYGRGFYNNGKGSEYKEDGRNYANSNINPLNGKLFDIFDYCKKIGLQIETTQALASEIIGDVKENEGEAWTPLHVDTSRIPESDYKIVRIPDLPKYCPDLLLAELQLVKLHNVLGFGDTDSESEISEFMLDSSAYDNKHINNLAPDKKIPYSVIEKLNKVGMTLESIDRLSAAGFPVCKYKTQVTVHGICPNINHGYVAGYKCLTINQNQSLGIRWAGIDSDKKRRIGAIANKIAAVCEKVEKTASFFYYRDSTVTSLRLVVCEVARQYPWIPEKAKEIAQDLVKKVNDNTKGLFFGYAHTICTKETYFKPSMYCVDIVILGIYENNIETFIRKVYNLSESEYKAKLAKYDELEAEYERQRKQEIQERERQEAEREKSLNESLPKFEAEFDKYSQQWEKQHPIPNNFVKCNTQDYPKSGDIICYYKYPSYKRFIKEDKYVFSDTVFDVEAELVFEVFYSSFGKMCCRRCNENGEKIQNDYSTYRGSEYQGGFQPNWFVKVKSAKKTTTTNTAVPAVGTSDLQIVDYSDKAIVLTGDTKPLKDQIKHLGGKFGSRFDKSKVPSGIGWLFPKTKLNVVQDFINRYGKKPDTAISPLLLKELELVKLHNGNGGGLSGVYNRLPNKFWRLEDRIFPTDEKLKKIYENICKSGKLSVTLLQQLKLYSNDTRRYINQISGTIGKDDRTYVGALVVRASASGHSTSSFGILSSGREAFRRRELQQRLLLQFAELEGIWYKSKEEFITKNNLVIAKDEQGRIIEGTESKLYHDPSGNLAYKFLRINANSNFLYDNLLERIIVHNLMFGDKTALYIEGFFFDSNFISIAVSQPFIRYAHRLTKETQQDKFFEQFTNFTRTNKTCIVNEDLVVYDLHNNNVLVDDNGEYYVIDCYAKFFRKDDLSNRYNYEGVKGLGSAENWCDNLYCAIHDFSAKSAILHPDSRTPWHYGRTYNFDGKGKWKRVFKLIDTTPSKYILRPTEWINNKFYFHNSDYLDIAVDSKTWENCFIKCSPLLLKELELVKLHNGNGGGLSGTKENLIQNFQQNIWKNGFNSVTLNQLDFLINDIQNGHIQSNIGRLNRYGRPCNYYIAVRAAIITRGEIGADKTKLGNKRNAQTWDRKSRIRRQTELLTEFATLSGCWLNDFSEQPGNVVYLNGKKYEYLAEGAENRVYDSGDKDEQRKVIKVIDIPTDWEHIFYDDVAEIFERILIHNCLFQNAVLNIVGFAYDGVFKIVLEQFYFKGVPPSDSEFDEFIKQRVGALKKVMDFYINDDFYLGDFHDKNVIKDKNGNIIVIDDMLAFNHGDFKGLKGFDFDWLYEDFKVGDKVVYIGKDYGNGYTTKGTVGTIVKIHKSRKASILNRYDLQIGGYSKVCGFENIDLRKLKLLESEAKLAQIF